MIEASFQKTHSFSQFQNPNLLKKKKEIYLSDSKLPSKASWRKFQAESILNTPNIQEQEEDSLKVNEQGTYLLSCYFEAREHLEEGRDEKALELICDMYNDPRIANIKDELFPPPIFPLLILLYKGQKEEAVRLLSEGEDTVVEGTDDGSLHFRKIMLYTLGIDKAFSYAPPFYENGIAPFTEQLEWACKYFYAGDYDLAISLCNQIIEKKSRWDTELATQLRADCHLLKGNIQEAKRDYYAADFIPQYFLTLLLLGEMEEAHDLWIQEANGFSGLSLGFFLMAFKKHPSMFRMDSLATSEKLLLKSHPHSK